MDFIPGFFLTRLSDFMIGHCCEDDPEKDRKIEVGYYVYQNAVTPKAFLSVRKSMTELVKTIEVSLHSYKQILSKSAR